MVTAENEDTSTLTFPRTDAGNGELFAHLWQSQVLYDHDQEHWLTWQGHRWAEDLDGTVQRLAVKTARHRHHTAVALTDFEDRKRETDFARRSENQALLKAMLAQAQVQPTLAARADRFDLDPWLLRVENGIVDLRTGELSPGRPEDLVSLCTPIRFDPLASCPRWEQFLREIFPGHPSMVDYIWRAVGYSLSGDTRQQCFFICYGRGANGKSVFLNTLKALAGDYGHAMAFSALEFEHRGQSDPHVAELVGRRLVTSSETNENTRLNEARLKALTGGDEVSARRLYHGPFSFVPQLKLWLAVNHKPQIRDDSEGSWRRIKLVPFTRRFGPKEMDRELGDRLKRELPGILAWTVRGCAEWQARGLEEPEEVQRATADYQQESDPLAEFITECCFLGEEASVQAGVIYTAYRNWAEKRRLPDREVLSNRAFGERLTSRFEKDRNKHHTYYLGLELNS